MSLGTFGSLAEKDADGVSHIELGINGSDGGVQEVIRWYLQCVCEPNY